jgi:hypothetical protein
MPARPERAAPDHALYRITAMRFDDGVPHGSRDAGADLCVK